jgi:hypothetical protein
VLLLLLLQASLYDVNALMDQAKQYNSDTKIALEIATLSVSFTCMFAFEEVSGTTLLLPLNDSCQCD